MAHRELSFFFGSLAAAVLSVGVCVAKIHSSQTPAGAARNIPFALPERTTASEVIGSAAFVRGERNAPYTLVELGDY